MERPQLPSFTKIGEKVDDVVTAADAAFNRLSAELIDRGGAPAFLAAVLNKRFQRKAVEHIMKPHNSIVDDGHVNINLSEQPTSPYTDADRLLGSVVNLLGRSVEDDEDDVDDRFMSRTVLNPYDTQIGFMPYTAAVHGMQEYRVEKAFIRSQLPSRYADEIKDKTAASAMRRYVTNVAASTKLEMTLRGQELSQETADLIWRAKAGDLTMHELGDLLLQFPQMEKIEAGHSINPLNMGGFFGMNKFVYEQLSECNKKVGVDTTVWPDSAPERRPRNTDLADGQSIRGIEQNVAELTKDGVTIQLVRHDDWITLPPDLMLKHVLPNLMKLKKTTTNQQPVETSLYWQVKHVEQEASLVAKSRRLFSK